MKNSVEEETYQKEKGERQRGPEKKLGRTVEKRFLMVFDFEKSSEPLPMLAPGSMLLHRN